MNNTNFLKNKLLTASADQIDCIIEMFIEVSKLNHWEMSDLIPVLLACKGLRTDVDRSIDLVLESGV